MAEASDIYYRINAQDGITYVNDEWSKFAVENGAPELIGLRVLNKNIWSFISGMSVDSLYRQIIQRVRSGIEMTFDLRCDSPELKRLLKMTVKPLTNGEIEFSTHLIWQKERTSNNMHDSIPPRSPRVIMTCSWCNRIEVATSEWKEIEEAFDILNFFRSNELPRLSHGICGDCYKRISKTIKSELDERE
jgi:hypothetical protein